jgi:hypothetical protein
MKLFTIGSNVLPFFLPVSLFHYQNYAINEMKFVIVCIKKVSM